MFSGNVAITGLSATDNPAPGVGVIRSLRESPDFSGRIVGLPYDGWEPGIYASDLVDDVFMIPRPSAGPEALRDRLEYIRDRVHIDAVITTLDSELPGWIALSDQLREWGIGHYLPEISQFELRSKSRLGELGQRAGIAVPRTLSLYSYTDLAMAVNMFGMPLVVKGVFYGAQSCRTFADAQTVFSRFADDWGYPVLAQEFLTGQEYNVTALGDGQGGLLGAVAMKKQCLTDKGKGWAGVTVDVPECIEATEKFMAESRWRGPCELEFLRTPDGRFYLLEINPRFPAWVFLCPAAGINLPWMCLQSALGDVPQPCRDYASGVLFMRISMDRIVDMNDFKQIFTAGELSYRERRQNCETSHESQELNSVSRDARERVSNDAMEVQPGASDGRIQFARAVG